MGKADSWGSVEVLLVTPKHLIVFGVFSRLLCVYNCRKSSIISVACYLL